MAKTLKLAKTGQKEEVIGICTFWHSRGRARRLHHVKARGGAARVSWVWSPSHGGGRGGQSSGCGRAAKDRLRRGCAHQRRCGRDELNLVRPAKNSGDEVRSGVASDAFFRADLIAVDEPGEASVI